MKLLFDESLSPRLVPRRILDYAAAHDFILVSTDSDFERLLRQVPGARVVIVRSCDYPTGVRPKCSGAMRSVSLNCPSPRISRSFSTSSAWTHTALKRPAIFASWLPRTT